MLTTKRFAAALTSLAVTALMLVGINPTPAAAANWKPGTGDTGFLNQIKRNGGMDDFVNGLVTQSDGKIVVFGEFTKAGGQSNLRGVARFNANGTPDTVFNQRVSSGLSSDAIVYGAAVQRNGQILVTGIFGVTGSSARGIARFNANGSLDTTFRTNVGSGLTSNREGLTVAVQSNGGILVGGTFTSINGINVNRIARLTSSGLPDTLFNAKMYGIPAQNRGFGPDVEAIVIQPDDKVIVAGDFTWGAGSSGLNRIARLQANGDADASFNGAISANGGVNDTVLTAALQRDGKIVVGGRFITVAGSSTSRVARFNADGSADSSFNSRVGNSTVPGPVRVSSVAVQPDGKLVIVGSFTQIKDLSAVNHLGRLNANGTPDNAFNSSVKASAGLNDVSEGVRILPNGKIALIGRFSSAAKVTGVNRLAVFNGDISKPNKPAALKVAGKRMAKTFKASWDRPSGATTTRPVTRYTVRVTVKGKKKVLITKHLSAQALRYNVKRSVLNRALRKNKVKRANNYRFTVRVVASNQMGSSSAAARAFLMKR